VIDNTSVMSGSYGRQLPFGRRRRRPAPQELSHFYNVTRKASIVAVVTSNFWHTTQVAEMRSNMEQGSSWYAIVSLQ